MKQGLDTKEKRVPEAEMADVHEGIQRRGHCLRNCVILFFILSLGLVFGIGFVVAKSGLAEVPLLSGWFGSRPEPLEYRAIPDDQLEQLEMRLGGLESQLATGQVEVILSEADLNALVRLKTPEASIDIQDGHVDVQTPVKYTGNELLITASIEPVIEAGKLRLELIKLRVGDLPLPAGLFNAIALQLQKNLIDTNPVVAAITFKEVSLENNVLILVGTIDQAALDNLQR